MEALGTILTWLILGSCAGWLAGLLAEKTGGSRASDSMDDSIAGMVGAFLCGFVQSLLLPGTFALTGFNVVSLLLTLISTMLLLFLGKRAMAICQALSRRTPVVPALSISDTAPQDESGPNAVTTGADIAPIG